MIHQIIILVVTQALFTTSDLMGKYYMSRYGFTLNTFFSFWFLVYMLIRIPATFGQLYIFTQLDLGRTMALFGAVSIGLSTTFAFFLFKEVLTPVQYVGVMLAVLAFLALTFIK